MLSTDSCFKMESEKKKQVQEQLQALVFEKHSSAVHQTLFQHTDRAALPIILESYITYFTSPYVKAFKKDG